MKVNFIVSALRTYYTHHCHPVHAPRWWHSLVLLSISCSTPRWRNAFPLFDSHAPPRWPPFGDATVPSPPARRSASSAPTLVHVPNAANGPTIPVLPSWVRIERPLGAAKEINRNSVNYIIVDSRQIAVNYNFRLWFGFGANNGIATRNGPRSIQRRRFQFIRFLVRTTKPTSAAGQMHGRRPFVGQIVSATADVIENVVVIVHGGIGVAMLQSIAQSMQRIADATANFSIRRTRRRTMHGPRSKSSLFFSSIHTQHSTVAHASQSTIDLSVVPHFVYFALQFANWFVQLSQRQMFA